MPILTRWYIRTSFLYLLGSLLVGVLIAVRVDLALPPVFSVMAPVYFHLFLVGWISQLIFGVIFWLFPKAKQPWQHWELLAWSVWAFLNVGLLLRAIAEPLDTLNTGQIWSWGLVISALFQWLAAMGFIIIVWPRVYSRPRKQR